MSRHPHPGRRADYAAFRPVSTRWFDNDIYGHLNNTVYYQLFDTAVNGMLQEAGLLDPLTGQTVFLVVESGCRYFAPVAHPATLSIGLRVAHLGESSVRYELGVFPEGWDQTAAEGHFVHVNVDREGRSPRPIPEATRTMLNGLMR